MCSRLGRGIKPSQSWDLERCRRDLRFISPLGAESFLSVIPDTDRDKIIDELRVDLKFDLCDSTGARIADYVRLRFSAEIG